MSKFFKHILVLCLSISCAVAAESDGASVLAQILAEKGTITQADLAKIQGTESHDRLSVLTAILQDKGLLNGSDLARLGPPVPAANGTTEASAGAAPASAGQTVPVQAVLAAKTTEPPLSRPSSPAILDPSFKTGKRIPVSIYGTMLFNAGYNTAGANIEDVPLFLAKQNSDPTGGDKNFYSTVRQTRLGVALDPLDAAGGKLTGDFEFDMFGGQAALPGGVSMNLFRMRLAYGRVDWKHFAVEVGQDWSVFAPLTPISFAEYGIPSLSASGNPWLRTPQIRLDVKQSSGANALVWQNSLTDPNMGDYVTTAFSTSRQPLVGERGRVPALDSRLAYTRTYNDRKFTLGLSGHYGHGKNAGTIGTLNVQTPLDSYGVALDYSLPLTRKFSLVGEAYDGHALGAYSSAAGEAVGAVGTIGGKGVDSRGGWIQAQTAFNKQWQLNLGYGQDSPKASQLPVGNRTRNQSYMGNLIYKMTLNINLALEYRRLLTDYRNQALANERGDHVDLAVLFTF